MEKNKLLRRNFSTKKRAVVRKLWKENNEKLIGRGLSLWINLPKPTGYVMHHQFNIQQLYTLTTLNLCV